MDLSYPTKFSHFFLLYQLSSDVIDGWLRGGLVVVSLIYNSLIAGLRMQGSGVPCAKDFDSLQPE